MTRIALVGGYGQPQKKALFDLLFTAGDEIGVRKYPTLNHLLNDRERPDLDLIVLMAGIVCNNLPALVRTLKTPALHLTIGSRSTSTKIENQVAIVELKTVAEARDQRFYFAMASSRRNHLHSASRFMENHWPLKLVPSELRPAPRPVNHRQ